MQNSQPFNAQQLNTVENAAINLGQNNPINFTPNPTYAPPNDLQISSLNGAGSQAFNAGQATSPWVGPQQLAGILANNGIVSGDTIRALQPFINQFSNLGSVNPAQSSIDNLQNNFGLSNPYSQMLANPAQSLPGSQLGYIGGGGLSPTSIVNALENPMSFAGASQLGSIANGGYLNSEFNNLNALSQAGTTGPGAGALANMYNGGALSSVSPYASGLTGLGFGASGAISPQTSGLTGYGYGAPGAISPYTQGLSSVASGGPAAGQLAATAQGQYLGQNPFLNQMFQSAANPVVNAYETATAPTIDSQMNAANRFGSGANFVQQSTEQQNLGRTLSNLQANIYGPAYQQERSNMVNAAQGLGSLQTNALNAAGGLQNAATGLGIGALGSAGQLQNAATGLGITGLENAGGLVGQGVNSLINAATQGGNLFTNGLTNEINAYNQGVNTIGGAANNLFTGGLGALGTAGSVLNTGAGVQENAAANLLNNQTTGLSNALSSGVDAAKAAGSLGVLGTEAQIKAAQGGANTYNTGVNQMLAGIGNVGALSQMPLSDYNAAYGTGAQQQALNQAQLQDINNRFYGNELSPWSTLQMEAGIVGNPITGSSTTQTPFFANPMQGLSSTLGAVNGANSLFGGSLFGGGAGGIGALGTGAINSELASGLGLAGGASAIPFTDFAGSAALNASLGLPEVGAAAGGADLGSAALGLAATVVCTELVRQGRMPVEHYKIYGKQNNVPKLFIDGYHVWGIPAARHLRKHPQSWFSKVLEKGANWRTENIAAHHGVEGAKKQLRGAAVTALIAVPCLVLGIFCKLKALTPDWRSLYKDEVKI